MTRERPPLRSLKTKKQLPSRLRALPDTGPPVYHPVSAMDAAVCGTYLDYCTGNNNTISQCSQSTQKKKSAPQSDNHQKSRLTRLIFWWRSFFEVHRQVWNTADLKLANDVRVQVKWQPYLCPRRENTSEKRSWNV